MKLTSNLSKVSLSSAIFCLSTITCAGTMGSVTPPSPFNGFYVGGGIVGVNLNDHITSMLNDFNPSAIANYVNQDAYIGFFSGGGRVNIGYGIMRNQGYVGAELAYRYAPTTGGSIFTTVNIPNPSDISAPNDFSVNVRGGYSFLSGMLAYGLIGFDETQFKYNYIDTNLRSHAFNVWSSGISPGAGVEFALSDAATVDLRYVYGLYGSNEQTTWSPDGFGGTQYHTFNAQPSLSTINLTFNYHFS